MEETISKEFTFKAKTNSNSYYKSPFAFNSKQLYSQTSSHFIPKQRSTSLPMNPPTPKENHYFDTNNKNQQSKRSRKHKIFDTYHSSLIKEEISETKAKASSAYFKQSPKQVIQIPPKQSYSNNLKKDRQEDLKKKEEKAIEKQPQDINYPDKSRVQINLKLSLIEKQKQISYLKLQLQRYKRCESLNKQNEELYKKIVNKLNSSNKETTQSFQVFKRRESDQSCRTPISSLSDLKLASPNQQSSSKFQSLNKQIQSNKVKNTNTEPLKTIPQNDENHVLLTENCTEGWAKSQSRNQTNLHNETLANNKGQENNIKQKTAGKALTHQNNYFYTKLSEKMAYHCKRAPRVNFNEIPINVRLQEMNKAIQKSFQTQVRPHYRHESPFKSTHKREGSKSKYGSSFNNTNSKLDNSYY